jgi:hypothetical protein
MMIAAATPAPSMKAGIASIFAATPRSSTTSSAAATTKLPVTCAAKKPNSARKVMLST